MKLIRMRQVLQTTGLSRMTIYRLERRGEFPQRRRLGRNSVAWIDEEVDAWVESRPAAVTAPSRSKNDRAPPTGIGPPSGSHRSCAGNFVGSRDLDKV